MPQPKTLFENIWNQHVVAQEPEAPAILYVDLHLVHEVTSPQAFTELRERGLLYLRNFSGEFDLGWREYYGCDSEAGAEAACLEAGTEFEWLPQGLRTWQRCPAPRGS